MAENTSSVLLSPHSVSTDLTKICSDPQVGQLCSVPVVLVKCTKRREVIKKSWNYLQFLQSVGGWNVDITIVSELEMEWSGENTP